MATSAELSPLCGDAISSLSWNPVAQNFLAVSSWDKHVRCWEIGSNTLKFAMALEAPLLDSSWNREGNKIFTGGCDNKVTCLDLTTQKTFVVGQHQAPIKAINMIYENDTLCTGSWDKTICYWDCRQQNPVLKISLNERVWAQDVKGLVNVVVTPHPNQQPKDTVYIYDMRQPNQAYRVTESPISFPTRCVSIFKEGDGFALGCTAGRVAIHYINENQAGKNFTFKCHRDNNTPPNVHAVNAISFHPIFGTFATAGSDKTICYWDKENRVRLKVNSAPDAITACAFNFGGQIFAYASSYDWCKGQGAFNSNAKNQIFLQMVQENDVKPRPKNSNS